MKKCISLLCVLSLLITACGCTGLFGGNNRRELGNFVDYMTANGKDYLEYRIFTNDGYVEIGDNSYKLAESVNATKKLSETETVFGTMLHRGRRAKIMRVKKALSISLSSYMNC